MVSEQNIVHELAAAGTIDEVMRIAKQAGHPLTAEQADLFLGRIEQSKSDVAELDGDTIASLAREVLGI